MAVLSEYIDRACARIAAIHNAKTANETKWEKVHSVDNYWHSLWEEPKTRLTDAQLKEVERFWSKYSFAYKNDPRVQEHFSSLSGSFNPLYCNNGLNYYYMCRFYDSPVYHTPFHDKNYREFLFHDVAYTPAYLHRVCGNYYDQNFNPISYDKAMSTLADLVSEQEEKLIVKPTPGGGGSGISFIRRGDSKEKIAELLDGIVKDDVIVERFMKAHPSYAIANPTSLNTLRIVTFLYDHEISIIGILFRMGATGKEVDNFTQGGVACGVFEDGTCMNYGTDHFGNIHYKHPNGFEFAGHKLYGVDQAIALAKKLHWRIPQFKQMSWDITIDENGVPTLIEMNPRGGANLYQMIGSLPFGEKTAQVLDDFLFTTYFNRGANWDWDYKEYADHIVLTGYGWNKKTVKVPETINGKYVTHISDGCFTGDRIQKILLPACVKSWSNRICSRRGDEIPEIVQQEDTRGIEIPSPVNLRGEAAPGRNVLHWEPVEGVTNYYVYRMKQGGTRQFVRALSSKATTFTDHNVLAGSVYYYYVCGFNSQYNMKSSWGKPASIRTLAPRDRKQ